MRPRGAALRQQLWLQRSRRRQRWGRERARPRKRWGATERTRRGRRPRTRRRGRMVHGKREKSCTVVGIHVQMPRQRPAPVLSASPPRPLTARCRGGDHRGRRGRRWQPPSPPRSDRPDHFADPAPPPNVSPRTCARKKLEKPRPPRAKGAAIPPPSPPTPPPPCGSRPSSTHRPWRRGARAGSTAAKRELYTHRPSQRAENAHDVERGPLGSALFRPPRAPPSPPFDGSRHPPSPQGRHPRAAVNGCRRQMPPSEGAGGHAAVVGSPPAAKGRQWRVTAAAATTITVAAIGQAHLASVGASRRRRSITAAAAVTITNTIAVCRHDGRHPSLRPSSDVPPTHRRRHPNKPVDLPVGAGLWPPVVPLHRHGGDGGYRRRCRPPRRQVLPS